MIVLEYPDGAKTKAVTAEKAVSLFWLYKASTHPDWESMVPGVVYVMGHVTFPTEGQPLIDLLVAHAERTYNETPDFTGEDVETRAMDVLQFLLKKGELTLVTTEPGTTTN